MRGAMPSLTNTSSWRGTQLSTWTTLPFTYCYHSHIFESCYWWWGISMYLFFSVFTSRPTTLLACNRLLDLGESNWKIMFRIALYYQHITYFIYFLRKIKWQMVWFSLYYIILYYI